MQFIVSLRKYCDIFEYELSRIILYDHLVYDKKFLIFEILLEVRMEFRKKSTLQTAVLVGSALGSLIALNVGAVD